MDDAALYTAIMQQHETLKEDMCRLRTAVTSGRQGLSGEQWRADTEAHLVKLRKCLSKHFELEEAGGYLEPVKEKRPTLSRSVSRLQLQHEEILAEIDSVSGACRDEAAVDAIVTAALRVLDLLRQHEAEESDLIQGAVGDDLGVGD
jgi:hypothetical protein